MVWRLATLRTYLSLRILSIIFEIMILSFLDFGLLLMVNTAYIYYLGISIRSSESLDIFRKRIKLVNFTSLLDNTCNDFFM